MNDRELLARLEELVPRAGIELRWEDGEFGGGTCRHENHTILLINRGLRVAAKIDLLCRALAHSDLTRVFILPAVRDRIEQAG